MPEIGAFDVSPGVDPAAAVGSASLLVGLLNRKIDTASVGGDGILRLELAAGGAVEVRPDQHKRSKRACIDHLDKPDLPRDRKPSISQNQRRSRW